MTGCLFNRAKAFQSTTVRNSIRETIKQKGRNSIREKDLTVLIEDVCSNCNILLHDAFITRIVLLLVILVSFLKFLG